MHRVVIIAHADEDGGIAWNSQLFAFVGVLVIESFRLEVCVELPITPSSHWFKNTKVLRCSSIT